jgi:hypothetical protein
LSLKARAAAVRCGARLALAGPRHNQAGQALRDDPPRLLDQLVNNLSWQSAVFMNPSRG